MATWTTASIPDTAFPRKSSVTPSGFTSAFASASAILKSCDQYGQVLDILVQTRRNTHAAKRFLRKMLKGLRYIPRVIITDKLKNYAAVKAPILPGIEHRQHKGLNNREEVSHQPTRLREKQMRRFKSAGQAQRFLSAHGPINNLFHCRRRLLGRSDYHEMREKAFLMWQIVTQAASCGLKRMPSRRWIPEACQFQVAALSCQYQGKLFTDAIETTAS